MYRIRLLLPLAALYLSAQLAAQPQNPYTVPEYAPSRTVLVEWDFNEYTWDLYSELIALCQSDAEVVCVVRDANEEYYMLQRLISDGVPVANVSFVHVPCERMWIRDHGPFAIKTDNGVAFLDFNDKADSGMDENLPTNLAAEWNVDAWQLPWIFDGGNLMVDSHGTLFCTNGLYDNNPGMSPQTIRGELETFMGITRVVALKRQHNDYWGHIDMQAKLLDDTTFVVSSVSPGHPNYDSLEANFNLLASLETIDGKPYRIRRLPHADDWKTYANALLLNQSVIVPVYDHPNDSIAVATYAELLPNHTVKTLNCNKIIGWEGALHCITMQLFDPEALVSAGHEPAVDEALHVEVSPNPVRAGAPLMLSASDNAGGYLYLSVFDAYGRLVYDGRHHGEGVQWVAPDAPGLYMLHVRHAAGTSTVRLMVVR